MADLPDWYGQVETSLTSVTNIKQGLDADKSASPSVGDVYLATDTSLFYVCFVTGTWQSFKIPLNSATVNNVTATRTIGSTYQNTSGKIMLVQIDFSKNAGSVASYDLQLSIGVASPTTQIMSTGVIWTSVALSGRNTIYVIVPPSWYYRAGSSNAPDINFWYETALL